jgi:pimeloyl-ACP methyl ester carboxylesterase
MSVEETDLTIDGDQYAAEVTSPDNTDHGVVLLPGANHGPYGDVFDRLTQALADHGIALLRYKSWGESDELEDVEAKTREDLFAEFDAAVEKLRERGYDRISVIGKSFGGKIALRHVPDPVDELVLWAPAVFLENGTTREQMVPPEDASLPLIDTKTLASHDQPVEILQGNEDAIPVENAHELADALPNGRVHVIHGADHSFVGDDSEDETIETTIGLVTDSDPRS